MLRIDLLEQVPNLAAIAVECGPRVPALRNIVSEYLLPLVVRNLGTKDNQVRNAVQSTLFKLMEQGLVSRQQAEIQVCPTVLALSKMECLMDYHTSAVTLMSKMAPLLGRDTTERVFLERFSELCSNHMFYVRKVCASYFGDFCAVVGKEAYEQVLLPCYMELCGDEVWGVRKACAEVVMSVSCACPPVARRLSLAPVFAKLLQDPSRWVRMSAFQTLGPFISTFADPTITSLAYNKVGELVLVNTEGTEFQVKLNSSSVLLCPEQDAMLNDLFNDAEDEEDKEIIINPLNDQDDIVSNVKNCMFNVGEDGKIYSTVLVDNLSDEINKLNINDEAEPIPCDDSVLSTSQSNELVNDSLLSTSQSNELVEVTSTIDREMKIRRRIRLYSHLFQCDVKENCVNSTTEESFYNNELLNCDVKENCVDTTVREECNSEEGDSCSEKMIVDECKLSEGDVDMFNSYNYWYVSPEMPLDPNIIDAGRSPKKNWLPEDNRSNCFTRHLDALYATINFDDTMEEILPNPPDIESICPRTFMVEGKPEVKSYFGKNQEEQKEPAQSIVPQLLVDHFISMTDPDLAQNTDSEIAYHCAYSLPAVALTLGSTNWHLLKGTVEILASDMQYKVRRTVASSLHELALILGPEIATNYLSPIFDGFIKDLDEVRIGVLKHLAHFLRLISPSKRNSYLPVLKQFLLTDNQWNWRFREELAEQLLLAVSLYRPSDAAKYIAALAQQLLCDKVAAVRHVALLLITELLKHISSKQGLTSRLLVRLAETFAHSKSWKRRQTFALLCSELLEAQALETEQFASEVMPHLLDLSWDPVANVRLVVARTISDQIIIDEAFSNENSQHYDGLQTVLRRLESDKDQDVRQCAHFLNFR